MQKRLVPKRTGALTNSIGYTFGSYTPDNANVRGVSAGAGAGDPDLSVTIHAGDKKAWYAALVEFGTTPHVIRPKRPGGLLNIHGRLVESISHPGATASPFFYPAYRALKKRAKSRVNRATTKSVKQAAGT